MRLAAASPKMSVGVRIGSIQVPVPTERRGEDGEDDYADTDRPLGRPSSARASVTRLSRRAPAA